MQVGNQTVDITLPKLKQAAKDVVKVISTIITDLSAIKDKIDFDDFEGSFACVDRIIEMINILQGNLKYIFLTHCQGDHIAGVKELREKMGGKVLIHRLDEEGLRTPNINLAISSV